MVETLRCKMAALSDKILPSPPQPAENEADFSKFTLEFVNPVPKEYLCTLCEEPMKKPCHSTCCGASYCGKCAKRLKDSSKNCKRCRSLSYNIDVDSQDEAMERLILDLKVYCPLKSPGCMWRGKLEELDDHLQWGEYDQNDILSCRYLHVPCPKRCSKLVPRRDMDVHLNMECKARMKQCVCGKIDLAGNIDNGHAANECVMRAVDCPNGCRMPGLRYKMLEQHMESECPLQMVNCEYENIGCDGWFLQKDLQAHNDSHIQEHFWLMCQKLVTMNRANEELRSSVLYSMSVCKKLEKSCKEILTQFDESRRQGNKFSTWKSHETVINTEVDAEENRSGDVASGYASMSTLRRQQRVISPGYYSRQMTSSGENNIIRPLPPPLPPRERKVELSHPGKGKTVPRAIKPVATGSIAFSRLTQSTSHLPSIVADDESQYRQGVGFLRQNESVSPSNSHYAHSREWGLSSSASTLSLGPKPSFSNHSSNLIPGTRRTASGKRRMLAHHRKVSTTLSEEEGYEKLESRVKLDGRVRSESIAACPSSPASRLAPFPSFGMHTAHWVSESSINTAASATGAELGKE